MPSQSSGAGTIIRYCTKSAVGPECVRTVPEGQLRIIAATQGQFMFHDGQKQFIINCLLKKVRYGKVASSDEREAVSRLRPPLWVKFL
jgi:hypothetical protein